MHLGKGEIHLKVNKQDAFNFEKLNSDTDSYVATVYVRLVVSEE